MRCDKVCLACVETDNVFYRNRLTSLSLVSFSSCHKKSDTESRLVIKKSNKARFNSVSPTSCHFVRDILAKVGLDKLENVADKPVEEAEKLLTIQTQAR